MRHIKIHASAVLLVALSIVGNATAQQSSTRTEPSAPKTSGMAEPALTSMSAEDQAMMQAWQKAGAPGAQHKQLIDQMVGTWNTKQTMWMSADAPPMVETGKAIHTAALDGRQVRIDFTGMVMGQPFEGVGYTGYDNTRGKYTSLWTDSMSTGMMTSAGDYDAATKTYTFHGEMADPMQPGKMLPIRETVRIVDADHQVMEMYEPKDGKEVKTMMIEYTRAD